MMPMVVGTPLEHIKKDNRLQHCKVIFYQQKQRKDMKRTAARRKFICYQAIFCQETT
jgi:hypothetical protein